MNGVELHPRLGSEPIGNRYPLTFNFNPVLLLKCRNGAVKAMVAESFRVKPMTLAAHEMPECCTQFRSLGTLATKCFGGRAFLDRGRGLCFWRFHVAPSFCVRGRICEALEVVGRLFRDDAALANLHGCRLQIGRERVEGSPRQIDGSAPIGD